MELYTSIQASGITDPLFHYDRFHLCPVNLLFEIVASIHKRDQTIANFQSIAIAKVGIYGFFGDKITIKDLLPFPELLETLDSSPTSKITKATAKAFREGVRSGFIPSSKIGAFFKWMDDIKRLTAD